MKLYSLRLWPNGEFGLGRYPVGDRPKISMTKYVESPPRVSWTKGEIYAYLAAVVAAGGDAKYAAKNLCPEHKLTLEKGAPLGSSQPTKTHTKLKRGSKGLTSYGAKMLRNGCFMLSRRAGDRNCALLTCTLPPMAVEIEKYISANWGEICRVFTQWVHRRLRAAGGCEWLVGCVEIQEKRMDRQGGFPLHLHLTFQAKKGKEYSVDKSEVSRAWQRAVCCVCPMAAFYDFSCATRIEGVKKSVERYLSKYISKGITDNVVRKIEEGFSLPSTWWYGVGGFKKLIKREIIYDTGNLASAFWKASFKNHRDFVYASTVYIQIKNFEYAVGVAGRIRMSLRNGLASSPGFLETWVYQAFQG